MSEYVIYCGGCGCKISDLETEGIHGHIADAGFLCDKCYGKIGDHQTGLIVSQGETFPEAVFRLLKEENVDFGMWYSEDEDSIISDGTCPDKHLTPSDWRRLHRDWVKRTGKGEAE